LRVTFLLTQSLQRPSGLGRYWPLSKELARLGHEVVVLALHHDFRTLAQRCFTKDDVNVRYVGQMHVRKVGSHKVYYGPLALLAVTATSTIRLALAALRTPGDVIHVCKTQPMNGVAAWVVHLLRRTPVYLDSDDYEAAHNRFSGRWQRRIVAWFEDWMPSFAEGITANTSFLAERFQSLGYPAERIRLVPNGVDRDRFALLDRSDLPDMLEEWRQSLGIGEQDRVVVYVGAMRTISHAVDLLLEAFVEVVQQEPDALLLLVGGGEDRGWLEQKAMDLKVSNRVRFLGHVPDERIPLYYRLGEVSVDPRRASLAAQSSLSLKLVESIVAGVPCVTTDVGDRRNIVGAAGIAVAPGDAQALAKGILSILGDAERAERMRAAAFQMRESLFWDSRVSTFAGIYT
jgi:glycosyltransferase involved in cell wall biosynthesis